MNKQKLTKEDLENGRDFWLWAAENPGKDKEAWPEYEERLEQYENECPFCEIHFYECSKCPLAIKKMECEIDPNSPYETWYLYVDDREDTAKEATQAALTIANVFQEEIDKLDGGKK